MGITIRQAKIADKPSLLSQIMIFEKQHALYEEGEVTKKTYKRIEEEISRDLKKKKYWVAEIDGKVVGFIKSEILDTRPGMLYIDNLFVHPEFRSRGIGTTLIQSVESLFKKKGANKMRLYVAEQNINAEKLYKKLGFKFHQSIWKEYIKEIE